ncbi:peptidase [Haloprofundus sp. MHR1]|uniref:pyroglutamyl-peptidase I family protein n=1 Tax=Haloprofundus sp. MHR1 TaxID=2572921 RepID=UPI0010BE99A6|nr:peptidase [Haloprofundus sp. MHR1]QCJ45919.1 peptidase [Haloprofundus sp. MHR1]
MTLVLTGYEPFGDDDENPTQTLAEELDGGTVAGHEIVGRVLPVEYAVAADEMATLVADYDPDVIVSTGLAAGRSAVSVERIGVNVNDCGGVADNADAEPRNEVIDADSADAYFSTLPVVSVVESLLDAGIPARVSNTAGTHLCNNVLYSTRALLEREGLETPMGFVHMPLTPEMAAEKASEDEATAGGAVEASLPLELQQRAVELTFETTLGG